MSVFSSNLEFLQTLFLEAIIVDTFSSLPFGTLLMHPFPVFLPNPPYAKIPMLCTASSRR